MKKETFIGIIVLLGLIAIGVIGYGLSKKTDNKETIKSPENISKDLPNKELSKQDEEILGKLENTSNTKITTEKQAQDFILQTISENSGSLDITLNKLLNNNLVENKDYYYSLVDYYLEFLYSNNLGTPEEKKIFPYTKLGWDNIDMYEKDEIYKTFLKTYISHMRDMQSATPKATKANIVNSGSNDNLAKVQENKFMGFEDIALTIPQFQKGIEDNLNANIDEYKKLSFYIKTSDCDKLENFDFSNGSAKFHYFNLIQNGKFFCELRKLPFPGSGLSLRWDEKSGLNYIKLPEPQKDSVKIENNKK